MTDEEIEGAVAAVYAELGVDRIELEYGGDVETSRAMFRAGMALAYEKAAAVSCPYCANGRPAEWRDDCGRWHPAARWSDNADVICEATYIHGLKDELTPA